MILHNSHTWRAVILTYIAFAIIAVFVFLIYEVRCGIFFLIHHIQEDKIRIESGDMNGHMSSGSHYLFGIIAHTKLTQQLVVHTYTIIRIGFLRMDVQDIEETTVAHKTAQTYHRTIVGLGSVVLQVIERRSIAVTYGLYLW